MAPRIPQNPPTDALMQSMVNVSVNNPFDHGTPQPARAPDLPAGALRPPRHVLRPIEDYVELDEEMKLNIPASLIPEGFDLQWVTDSVWGRPEKQHRARFERQGWLSVLADDEIGSRLKGLFVGTGDDGEIIMDGLVLMARPLAFSMKAKQLDRRRAVERVQVKEHQLRTGNLSGITLETDHPTVLNSNVVRRSLDTIAVPQQ